MRISGEVVVQDGPERPASAVARVRVQDTGRADAAAETLAEATIEGVRLGGGSPAQVPFEVVVDDVVLARHGSCTLAVHLDVGGTGEVTSGDYVTTRSVPAPAPGDGPVRVLVQRVG